MAFRTWVFEDSFGDYGLPVTIKSPFRLEVTYTSHCVTCDAQLKLKNN